MPLSSGRTKVLTVGSIPPEWGGPVAGGVATVHRGIVETMLNDPTIELIGVVPNRVSDRSLVPSAVKLFQGLKEAEYLKLTKSADVVVMNHVAHGYGDYQARGGTTPTIGVVHSWTPYIDAGDKKSAGRRIQQNLDAMAGIVDVSDVCHESGLELGFSYNTEARVIRNFVPAIYSDALPERRRDGALFVGTLNETKRPDLMIQACLALGVQAKIAGDGLNRVSLEAMASGRDVKFLGEISELEVREQMSQARVLCVPSKSEGFPLVFLEAAASGTPIVGYGPTLDELSKVTGISCGVGLPGDAGIDRVVDALRYVLDSSWDHHALRSAVAQNLSYSRMMQQYVDFIHDIAAAGT